MLICFKLVAFWIRLDSCLVIKYFEHLLNNIAEYIINKALQLGVNVI